MPMKTMTRPRSLIIRLSAAPLAFLLALSSATAAEKPVKVYILSGQSNMVGIGQVDGGGVRLGEEITDAVLSMYAGTPDASADYDKMKPEKTMALKAFGGTNPEPYPKEGVAVLRGQIQMPVTGVYEFRPGYGASEENIMVVNGTEVCRKEPGGKTVQTPIKLEAGKKYPFKITHLNDKGSAIGWYARLDIPGTLKSVVNYDGKFKYLVDDKGNFVPRDDVWYKGVVTATGDKWLDIGCGASPNSIGPELGFGHMVGNFHDEPVLILKASQGNRSLSWDFLPPGSESFEHTDEEGTTWVYAGYKQSPERWKKGPEPTPIDWYAGKQYDECFDAAKEVLAKFDEKFPQWKGRGYEIAGFGWWQGHKDGGEQGKGSRRCPCPPLRTEPGPPDQHAPQGVQSSQGTFCRGHLRIQRRRRLGTRQQRGYHLQGPDERRRSRQTSGVRRHGEIGRYPPVLSRARGFPAQPELPLPWQCRDLHAGR